MNLKLLKHMWLGIGAVALLAVMAACGTANASGSLTSLDLHAASSSPITNATPQHTFQPQQSAKPHFPYSALTLVLNGNSGNITVKPGSAVTVRVNGASLPLVTDSVQHTITVADANAITNASVDVTVPSSMDMNLSEVNGTISVTGISGQMNLIVTNGGNIFASQTILLGNSHLHVGNGTINYDGRLDSNSDDLFDANAGWISVKLPHGDSEHVDARTNAGNITTNVGTVQPYGTSGSQLKVSTQPALGAVLTVRENSGSMQFMI